MQELLASLICSQAGQANSVRSALSGQGSPMIEQLEQRG